MQVSCAGIPSGLGLITRGNILKTHSDGSLRIRIKPKQIYLRNSFLRSALFAFQLLNNLSSFLLFRLFGTKCAKCSRSVTKNDFVMRAKNQIYHIDCFRCIACSRQLVPGDEFALQRGQRNCGESDCYSSSGTCSRRTEILVSIIRYVGLFLLLFIASMR